MLSGWFNTRKMVQNHPSPLNEEEGREIIKYKVLLTCVSTP